MSTDTATKTREMIQTWLLGEGWQLTEQSHEHAQWLLRIEDKSKRVMSIALRKTPSDQIAIQATVNVAEDHRQRFASLPDEIRRSALWDMRFLLLGMNVEFRGVGDPLEQVLVSQRIYLEGLSKDVFAQRLSLVKNALIAVIWSLMRRLEGTVSPEEAGGEFLH